MTPATLPIPNVKMTPEHQTRLAALVTLVFEKAPGAAEQYERGDFPRADAVKDLQARFAWDVYAAAMRCACAIDPDLQDDMYRYLNDAHIATVLKHLVPTVTRRY